METGANQPTISELVDVLNDVTPIDRTTINSWEDAEFRKAVEATGRKKLIMTALWTEASLSFPVLDALENGYDVYTVNDAVGVHRSKLMKRRFAAWNKPVRNLYPRYRWLVNCSAIGTVRIRQKNSPLFCSEKTVSEHKRRRAMNLRIKRGVHAALISMTDLLKKLISNRLRQRGTGLSAFRCPNLWAF